MTPPPKLLLFRAKTVLLPIDWICVNIQPYFLIRRLISDDVVVERSLPHGPFPLSFMYFPRNNGLILSNNFRHWRAAFFQGKDHVDMIRHYHILIYFYIFEMLFDFKDSLLRYHPGRIQLSRVSKKANFILCANRHKIVARGAIIILLQPWTFSAMKPCIISTNHSLSHLYFIEGWAAGS